MSRVFVQDTELRDIADAIREKNGTEDTYKPSEMGAAIRDIESGADLSAATATAADIRSGLTAYTAEGLTTGTAERSLKKLIDGRRSAGHIFQDTSTIKTVDDLINREDTVNAQSMEYMFEGCGYLESVPDLNTSNVTNMWYMFQNCKKITTIPKFDTRKVTTMASMFKYAYKLTTIPDLDTRNVGSMSDMFYNCSSLTEIWIKNIKVALQVGSGTSWGHLLTYESLLHLLKELIDTGSSKTLTVGSANLEKLADTYVKLVTITDEMIAEDEFIESKFPFEVCESTDEGAMSVNDYLAGKNWTIA